MILHLIRHGKTAANEKGLYCGFTDLPLSPGGIGELRSLKEKIAYPRGDIYICGTLGRTIETLDVLYTRQPDMVIEEFNEMNFGQFEMKSHAELKDNPDYLAWIRDIEKARCPNGEGQNNFLKRIQKGLAKLVKIQAKHLVLITHGGVIATIMEEFLPKQNSFYHWLPGCGRGWSLNRETTEIRKI